MKKKIRTMWLSAFIIVLMPVNAQTVKEAIPSSLPVIPVGLDAYRMWDKWPQQRIGARAYMRSTYDRRGANERADASHFLFVNAESDNVTLDLKGKGVFYFFRTNRWHGSPWNFKVDGKDNIVKETATSDPVNALKTFTTGASIGQNYEILSPTSFIPSAPFPGPLNFTWTTTRGADLIWTPMPFKESFQIAYGRTFYGTGYYIYHLFADENNLSQPLRSWDINQTPSQDVLDLINKSGTDIAPARIKKLSGKIKLNKERMVLADIKGAASVVRAVKFILPLDKAVDLDRIRLVVTWDGSKYPSIDAPLCLFFGAGTFYNRDKKEFLVKAFPVNIRFDYPNKRVEAGCYFPMPFFKSARFELVGINPDNSQISYEIRYEPINTPANTNSYFHATYKDIPKPEPGKDMIFLDTEGAEGQKEWSGSFVGTSFIFSQSGVLTTLEGDPRFFFDDSQTPQAQGTGTEEWGGGGSYWGGKTMTLPFAGHPNGIGRDTRAEKISDIKSQIKNEKELIESAYRFLLADMMPFGKRAKIHLEHGGENMSVEHYESVTYWYGLPAPSLIKTDDLDVGNLQSEKDHNYNSPDASFVESVTSRYELGMNVFPDRNITEIPGYKDLIGKEIYPAHVEDGRFTRGQSEFTVKLDAANKGAILRRTLDYKYPNQTAEVYIADDTPGQITSNAKWEYAGIWYLAGSNTYLYSYPTGEMDNRQLEIQISNRRFRDDEFILPARLTENRSAIRVRIKRIPDNQELLPGTPFPNESYWSELRYQVYSYIIPRFQIN